jgi:hypothetical protein
MSRLPVQWITWNHAYVLEDPMPATRRPSGQFQYALKDTAVGHRQAVVEAGSNRGVIAVVDFAGHNRKAGSIYYAWGAVTYLPKPVDQAAIASDVILRDAFSNRQGRAKHLAHEAAVKLDELADGLPKQRAPADEPDENAELELWIGARGRAPEFLIHDEVETTRRLWRHIGFKEAPRRGHRLKNGQYPDLYSPEGVVGEVKNVIGPNWGPAQLRGYMRQLDSEEPEKDPWRGVLIHGGETLSPASRLALRAFGGDVTVWSIQPRKWRGSRAHKQFP